MYRVNILNMSTFKKYVLCSRYILAGFSLPTTISGTPIYKRLCRPVCPFVRPPEGERDIKKHLVNSPVCPIEFVS